MSVAEFVLVVFSYLVGVVIVVLRSFSMRRLWKWWSSVRLCRFMLMSPIMKMSVLWCFDLILFRVCVVFSMYFVSWCGRRYVFMRVYFGSFNCLFLCILSIIDIELGMEMSFMGDIYKFSL